MKSKSSIELINTHLYLYKERLLTISSIIVLLTIISFFNYYLFHSVAEVFSCAIAYAIFLFSLNTHRISKSNFFILLGIGYFFVAIIDLLHTFTYGDLTIFANRIFDDETKFWIAARIIEAGAFLIATASLYKNDFKPNYYLIFFVYFAISAILIIDILYLGILIPSLQIEGIDMTKFKIYSEYIIMAVFFINFLLIYKVRKIEHSIFSFILLALILKIISEFFFTLNISNTDIINTIGHLVKVCSSYFIYIGLIVNGIYKPFDLLDCNLREANSKYQEKEKQRKYLDQLINKNEHCYDLLIDNSSNCIVIIKKQAIVYANSTAVNTFGVKDVFDLIGRSIWDFINIDTDQGKYLEKLKGNVDNSKFVEIDLKNLDGDNLKFEYSMNNITYKGKPVYLVVLRNVSHREEIKLLKSDLNEREEKLLQSKELNKELTEFFTNISHELKTPLNIIIGSIQLIFLNEKGQEITPYFEKQNTLLKIMKQNAYRLVKLVNNLIDISKYDVGYLKLNMNNYNIVSIVEDITLSVCEYYKMKGIKIIFDTNTEEKIMAVDCDKIERIMLNLLSNSIKFTDEGGEVLVDFKDMGEKVMISVKDTGIGIPEDKIEVIFNRFEQVDKTFTRKREGSGIGLALVKSLVEMHSGSINVTSIINEGSEFIFELPVTIIENDEIKMDLTFENKEDKINIEFSDIYS